MRKFLTAEWRDLVMANYEVSPDVVRHRMPAGCEIDLHEGKFYVSLVGFMFLNTRVLGLPIPFHINFEEVNLRFYVKRELPDETRRGVVFVKELVPRSMIALVARTMYGEPYEAWKMDHTRGESNVGYSWHRGDERHAISVKIDEDLGVPGEGSHGEFIIEHYWGYTKRGGSRTDEYKVEHPKWELFSTKNVAIDVDFGKLYGSEYAFLNDVEPASVLLAKGSEIAVYKGKPLKI